MATHDFPADVPLANHLADTTGAHSASAISFDDTAISGLTAPDVQAALASIGNPAFNHIASLQGAHGAVAILVTTGTYNGQSVQDAIVDLDARLAALEP
ncbi:MAG: hypothetical protein ACH37Z_18800 [Anaerolineae bacterium]